MFDARRCAVALSMLLVGGTCLRAQRSLVIPQSAATVDPQPYVSAPFTVDVGRFQHLVRGDAITPSAALLREFSYRVDQRLGSAATGRVVPRVTLRLGYSAQTPVTMSSRFAANRSGTQTQIFSSSYRLPKQPTLTGPGPWNVTFKLAQPFLYVRSKGNLLIEFEMPGRLVSLHWYPLDAFSGSKGGTMRRFGTAGRLAGGDPYEASPLGLYLLHPGGRLMFGVDGLRKRYAVLASLGLSNLSYGALRLPFDLAPLGAAGNHLLVRPDVLVPISLQLDPKSNWFGSVSLPLPKTGAPARVYAQAWILDPASNRLGMVMSRGVELGIDSKPGAPTQCLQSSDSTQATGQLGTRWGGPIGGPVIRLTGVGLR